ncbi:WD repeat-containing protein 36 [Lucilia cuprina]|uniref:WD repeat-containing protein 36 n=1 Tax=Lucilia cuprina TaxID=7375 RepID=UPI001F068AE8|nr:WD repeat-containing protein 36 [Lucilia cuprina]
MTNSGGNEIDKSLKGKQRDSSVIFRRNRSLGYVSNHIPAVVRYILRRKDNLITTCIGRSFQVYTSNHFRLLHVSGQHPDEITALATDRFHIYTACNKWIYAWRAGKHVRHIYKGHTKNVHLLLPFAKHLIAVDEANVLKVWDIVTEEVYLEVPFNADEFQITAIAHPPTYINKVVLGSKQGQLKIWNLKDNRLIYTFTGHASRVTCIEPAPAIDVVAVGHQDGTIIVMNLKFDEVLMEFKQDWGAVSKITFRTDGPPIMASASTNGYIAFWNLEEKKIASQLQAHEDSVTTAICLPNEPLILTTSPDNSMKLWIFDLSDGGARMLRIREGHNAPPLCIRYHGSNGRTILSSGEDSSLRAFSVISETLNKSLGKASYNKKASKKKNRFQEDNHRMPPIIEFTTELTREKEWDNIAAIHTGTIQTTTWSFHKNRMGEHHLIPEKFTNRNRKDFKAETTCLTLTHCGNFVIIGYSSGDVERFNIQSGIHRASYGNPAHKAAIRGVACDNLNQVVVTGCSDGLLKFWHFKENADKPLARIQFKEGISLIRCHRESAMIAVALVDFTILVIDLDTKVVIRKFQGHSAKINDVTFSPDSRWLISASMDATIKIWDIPSSYMIDHFRVEKPCVSLTMSPTGDFLATAHVNNLGIYLWANKMLFSQISLRSINPKAEAPYVGLPSNVADQLNLEEAVDELSMDVDDEEELGEEIALKYETPEQLSKELITMSGVAASRWQNLLDFDIIKKRNKPKAPPKVPKQAPFFLPTVAGLEMKFDVTNAKSDDEDLESRVLQATSLNNLTNFGKLLEATSSSQNYEKCVQHLKQLGPSMIDFEVKSLHPIGGGTVKAMVEFLKTLKYMFESNQNFELAQSYLSVFLRSHGLNLVEIPEVMESLEELSKVQESSWKQIEEKLMYGMGVVAALRNFVH